MGRLSVRWTRIALACVIGALAGATSLAGGWPGDGLPGTLPVARAGALLQQTPTAPGGPTRPGAFWGERQPPLPAWGEGIEVGPREELLPRTGIIEVLIELGDPPAARVYAFARALRLPEALARTMAEQQAQAIDAAQRALLPSLTAPDINATILGRTQHTLNGILIRVDASKLDAIRRLPGVLDVRRLRIGEYTGQPAPSALPGPARSGSPAPVMPGQPDGHMTG